MPFEDTTPQQRTTWQAIRQSGFACRCPRCANAPLFEGLSRVRSHCPACNLDMSGEDSGDGPAPFLTMILGVIFVPLVIWFEYSFLPPFWLHLIIWPPLVIGLNIALLRPMKATLIALQYRFKAGEQSEPAKND